MKQYYTYLHCYPNGEPFYVGKGSGKRAYDFSCGRSIHHKNIVAKHGRKNIAIHIFTCDSESQAFADEVQQIAQLKRDGYKLCNYSVGGEGGATGIKRAPFTNEHRAKIAAKGRPQKGVPGKPHTEETKAKIRAARALQVMKTISEETRRKLSESKIGNSYGRFTKGTIFSDERRAKMAKAMIGNKNALGHDGSGTGRPRKSIKALHNNNKKE